MGTLKVLRNAYEANLWQAFIPVDTRLRDASRSGVTPSQYDAGSRAVLAYKALLKHLLALQTAPQVA